MMLGGMLSVCVAAFLAVGGGVWWVMSSIRRASREL